MKLTDFYVAQLETESARTRRTLERVPKGRGDWKPHDKSMPLGRLAMLVARMPSWINLVVNQDELKRVIDLFHYLLEPRIEDCYVFFLVVKRYNNGILRHNIP